MFQKFFGLMIMLLLCACGTQQALPGQSEFTVAALKTAAPVSLSMQISGVSYYPRQTPWNLFWANFDQQVVGADFARIHQLGFNTVRIFVDYAAFGGARVKPEMARHLQELMDQAEVHELKVIPTLFDQALLYNNQADASAHLQQLVPMIAQHRALLAWDLKNESDSDYAVHGASSVKAWVASMAQQLHRLDPHHPVTASYADADKIGSEVQNLDYLTFHYYGHESAFAKTVASLQQRFAGKQLVLGEFGFHTWAAKPGDPHPAAHQFNYFNAILAAAAKARLQGTMVWNLYDYPELPQVPFLTQAPVNHYLGLIGLDDQPKAGILALQQQVRMIDSESQGAVTPLTQKPELVLNLATAGEIELQIRQKGQTLRSLHFKGQQGVNSLDFGLSPEELADLLSLRSEARVTVPGQQPQTLILRRD